MSKYVKNLVTDHLRQQFDGVNDALLVNMVGLGANENNVLRAELAEKGIEVLVVKNSLAARATAGTALDGLFEDLTGTNAMCWGTEDVVSLAKEVVRLAKDKRFEAFEPRGGMMDGERLSADEVQAVSKWPSREEQLSLMVGQILGPGSKLSAQLIGPGGALASQIKQKAEDDDASDGGDEAAEGDAD
jgi:large subunit ribosomal protein L10